MRIFFSGCNRILLNNGLWNQLRLDGLQLLEALVDGDFADLADAVHVFFGDIQIAHLRDKVDDAGGNGMRRIFRYHVVLLNAHGHENAELGEFRVYVQRTAIPFNECSGLCFLKIGFFGILQVVFQIIDDRQRIFAALGGALVVQMEDAGNLFGGARAPVRAARNVNGCRNNSVAVFTPERFMLRYFFMVAQRAVNDHFRNAGIGCRVFDALKFVIQRFFGIGHGLPFRVSPNFSHFIAGRPLAQHLAPVG